MRIRVWMFGQGGGGGRVYFSRILMSKATAKRNIFFQNIVGSLFETLSVSVLVCHELTAEIQVLLVGVLLLVQACESLSESSCGRRLCSHHSWMPAIYLRWRQR